MLQFVFSDKKNCQRNEETASAFMKKKLLLILAFFFLSDPILPTCEDFPFAFNESKPSPAIYYKVYFSKNIKYELLLSNEPSLSDSRRDQLRPLKFFCPQSRSLSGKSLEQSLLEGTPP